MKSSACCSTSLSTVMDGSDADSRSDSRSRASISEANWSP
jgi:hypothetical protein